MSIPAWAPATPGPGSVDGVKRAGEGERLPLVRARGGLRPAAGWVPLHLRGALTPLTSPILVMQRENYSILCRDQMLAEGFVIVSMTC